MHPLLNNLTELTDEQLYAKHAELTKKLTASYRLGYGDVIYQMQLIIGEYQAEIGRRQEKAYEEMQKRGKQFTNIIDVQ